MKSLSTEKRQRLARFLAGDKNALNGYRIHRPQCEEPPGYPDEDPRKENYSGPKEVSISFIKLIRQLEGMQQDERDHAVSEWHSNQFRDYLAKYESWLLENGYLGWMKQNGHSPKKQ